MDPKVDWEELNRYPVPFQEPQVPSSEFRKPLYFEDEPSLLHSCLELLRRRKRLIISFTALVVGVTLLVTLSMDPLFLAKASVELTPHTTKVTKFEDLIGDPDTAQFLNTQIELFQSRALADRVVKRLDLVRHPAFNPDLREEKGTLLPILTKLKTRVGSLADKILVKTGFKEIDEISQENKAALGSDFEDSLLNRSLAGTLINGLTVLPQGRTSILSVTYSSTDPKLARDVVNTLIEQFIDWQMDRRIDAAKTANAQLEKQIVVVRQELEKAEKGMTAFSKNAGIVSLDTKLNIVYQQLEQINAALARAETERITKKELYEQARKEDPGASSLVMQHNLIQSLRNQYIGLMSEYEQLRVTFKDDFPKMKNLKARMLDIGKTIVTEQERVLLLLKSEYLAALSVEKKLMETAEEKKAMALELNEMAGRFKILERDVEINKQIYHSLLERSKEIDANVGTDIGNIRIVDLALLPTSPFKPRLSLNLLVALVLGFIGGAALAFILEHLDDTVKDLNDVSDRHCIRILGVVPTARVNENKDLGSMVLLQPLSAFTEAIRFAKMAVHLSAAADNPVRALLITSIAPEEGKSTIAANLAEAFAVGGERVLLIDADLRRPSLQKYFNNNGDTQGLSHFLTGLSKLEEIIHETELSNLFFIPSGLCSPNPTELLASNRMANLIDSLLTHYDRIIFDGPPFGSDVLALGNLVSGIVLITTMGQIQHDAFRIFNKNISYVQGRLLGAIVNKFSLNNYPGGYYSKYYSNYYPAVR